MTTIYIDTETGPSRRVDVAAWLATKHFDADDLEGAAKKATAALERTSLQATLGEIHVISLAIGEGEPVTLISNGDEGDLMRRFAQEMFDIIDDGHYPFRLVAYNMPFDRAMIRVRAMAHRVRLPRLVHDIGVKPWDSAWRCAMEPLKVDFKDNVSLVQACLAFGIPLSYADGGDIPGSEVGAALARGEIERVAHHCALDVRRLREVWRHICSVDVDPVAVSDEKVERIARQLEVKR